MTAEQRRGLWVLLLTVSALAVALWFKQEGAALFARAFTHTPQRPVEDAQPIRVLTDPLAPGARALSQPPISD